MSRNKNCCRFCWGIFFSFFSLGANAQILPDRYVDPVFSSVTETSSVKFSTSVPQPKPGGGFYEFVTGLPLNAQEDNFNFVDLNMDVFEPAGDTMEVRPLIIIAFGGGFLDNDRNDWAIRLLAQSLAYQGFVTASIDYRLGMNIFDMEKAKRAVYRGLQDGRSAVRYFKKDAATSNTFRIDTNNIFMGGHSSGAFIALHTAYLDKDSERPSSTREGFVDGDLLPDQGCMDCAGDNQSFKGDVRAIFNLAGAIGDTDYLENSTDPPLISFHSTDDGTVPYYSGEPFSDISLLVLGSDLPIVYGSDPIASRADAVDIPNIFNTYTSRGHDVHIATSVSLHNDIVPEIADWFYQRCLKPEDLNIDGNQLFCLKDTLQAYQALGGNPKYFDWQIIGGSIVQGDILSDQVIIDWDPSSPNHFIDVTPYSVNGARGDKTSLSINFEEGKTISWIGSDGDWSEETNWDLNRIPLPCNKVEIENDVPINIIISGNKEISIQSLRINQNISIQLLSPALLNIKPYH